MILLIILIAILIIVALVLVAITTDVFGSEETEYIYEVEKAYEEVLNTGDMKHIYRYATVPMSLALVNRIRYDTSMVRGTDFNKAEIDFEIVDHLSNETETVYLRTVVFAKVKKELYNFGDDTRELWYFENSSNKLKQIKKVKEKNG